MRDSCNVYRTNANRHEFFVIGLRSRFLECMHALEDGNYDAFIIDAHARDDALALELTITSGAHRGEVVNVVTSTYATRDALDLLGLPCTLIVAGDELRVRE
jgi:hypothetical protein